MLIEFFVYLFDQNLYPTIVCIVFSASKVLIKIKYNNTVTAQIQRGAAVQRGDESKILLQDSGGVYRDCVPLGAACAFHDVLHPRRATQV